MKCWQSGGICKKNVGRIGAAKMKLLKNDLF